MSIFVLVVIFLFRVHFMRKNHIKVFIEPLKRTFYMNLFLDSFSSHCKYNIEIIKKMMRNIICNLLFSFGPTGTNRIHNKKSKGMKEIFDFFRSYQKKKNKQCGRRDNKYNATRVFV